MPARLFRQSARHARRGFADRRPTPAMSLVRRCGGAIAVGRKLRRIRGRGGHCRDYLVFGSDRPIPGRRTQTRHGHDFRTAAQLLPTFRFDCSYRPAIMDLYLRQLRLVGLRRAGCSHAAVRCDGSVAISRLWVRAICWFGARRDRPRRPPRDQVVLQRPSRHGDFVLRAPRRNLCSARAQRRRQNNAWCGCNSASSGQTAANSIIRCTGNPNGPSPPILATSPKIAGCTKTFRSCAHLLFWRPAGDVAARRRQCGDGMARAHAPGRSG